MRRADSASSPIFHARVDVTENGVPLSVLKTYFDGSYKFNVNKDKSYSVKISYAGYKDTTFTFKTDKKGIPDAQQVTVRLQKDGTRLIGRVLSSEDNFPISYVAVVLKNLLTRDEQRIYTGNDGAYNFRLESETNYKLTIDKRSPGIFNKYKDTSFYISTIGYQQASDYKLDILLDPVEDSEGYGAYAFNGQRPKSYYLTDAGGSTTAVAKQSTSDLRSGETGREPEAQRHAREARSRADEIAELQAQIEDSIYRAREATENKKIAEFYRQQTTQPPLYNYSNSTNSASATAVVASRGTNKQAPQNFSSQQESSRAKWVADSLARAKARQDSINNAREAAIKMKQEKTSVQLRKEIEEKEKDFLSSLIAEQRAREEAAKKAKEEEEKRKAREAEAAAIQQALADSMAKVRQIAEMSNVIKLQTEENLKLQERLSAVEKKMAAESAARAAAEIRTKQLQDSVSLLMEELQRIRAGGDNIHRNIPQDANRADRERVKEEVTSLRASYEQELARIKQERDALQRAKEEAEKQLAAYRSVYPGSTGQTSAASAPAQAGRSTTPAATATKAPETNMSQPAQPNISTPNTSATQIAKMSVTFLKNTADITNEGMKNLNTLAQTLKDYPKAKVKVVAYASADEASARLLSLSRSDVVMRQLVNLGVDIGNIQSSYVGNSQSVNGCTSPNCPEELLVQNRCATITVEY
ncbi:MAG: OmpA family protein [Chitinophagales bacterium]|nr:OmpA family protein [Chitinophagales bacterium]